MNNTIVWIPWYRLFVSSYRTQTDIPHTSFAKSLINYNGRVRQSLCCRYGISQTIYYANTSLSTKVCLAREWWEPAVVSNELLVKKNVHVTMRILTTGFFKSLSPPPSPFTLAWATDTSRFFEHWTSVFGNVRLTRFQVRHV